MKQLFKRRNFFIKKDFQGRLIYHSFILAFVGVIAFALVFSFLSADHLTISYQHQQLQIGRTPLVLFKEIFTAYWVFLVAVGLFIVLSSLLLSHRIAGPLYRLERAFTAMEEKNLNQQIHLRSKDIGKDLTAQLNRINDLLSADLRRMKSLCAQMEQAAGAEGEQAGPERLQQLRRQAAELQGILAAYELRPEDQ